MTRIGTSDLEVFPLNLGSNVFGWTADRDASFAVLDAYRAAGGNFVDTADSYSAWVPGNTGGEAELIIGEWMRERGARSDVVVATKVSQHPQFPGLSADNIADAADASLTRLGTDHIDLYYAHFDDENTPLEETVGAFDALVRAGKVRYVGISNYSADRVDRWVEIAKDRGYALPVALQPHYNLVHREPFEAELAEVAERNELAVMPYFSIAAGFLTGKYRSLGDIGDAARAGQLGGYASEQGFRVVDALVDIAAQKGVAPVSVALAWLRDRPAVVAPIASARTVEQLPDLLAGATLTLDAEETGRLDAVSGPRGERAI
jgi:aryl-alcohol dehydrogenase-like predicted oxidoreductase